MNPSDEFGLMDYKKDSPFPPGKASKRYGIKMCCSTMFKLTVDGTMCNVYPSPHRTVFGQTTLYCPYCGKRYEWEEI